MAYESYCASCSHLSENKDCRRFFCFMQGQDVYANAYKCSSYLKAYTRSDTKIEEMYRYSSGYYITTAILSIVRALDNNYQIQVIGDFIENTLKKDMQYFPLLYAYEIIGPQIANKLQQDKNKIRVAATMFYQYIKPTIKAIENNETENAVNIYKTMTIELAKRYNVDTNIILPDPTRINITDIEKGISRKRVLAENPA